MGKSVGVCQAGLREHILLQANIPGVDFQVLKRNKVHFSALMGSVDVGNAVGFPGSRKEQ